MNNTPSWVAGKRGLGLSFAGASRWVDVGNASSLNITTDKMSIAMWLKSTGTGYCLVDKDRNTAYHTQLANQNLFDFRVNTTIISGSTIISAGQWYHLAGVYDGSFLRIYVNGVSDATPVARTGSVNVSAQNVFIGKCADDFAFRGTMDDVRIYNRALSVSEISMLANNRNQIRNARINNAQVK